jgi:predicted TIM-barrel fold metal-dependent hydrolase
MKALLSALLVVSTLLLAIPNPAQAAKRPPIIDMHMHAMSPHANGPPPVSTCTPVYSEEAPMPVWDPGLRSWLDTFVEHGKKPACKDPIWSPTSDGEMRDRTLGIMEKYNVIGVVDFDKAEYRETWRKAAPGRIIPGRVRDDLSMDAILKIDAAAVARVKAAKEAGNLAVLAEIVSQYQGILPTDERLEPFWKMAEDLDIPVGIHVGTGPPGAPYLGSPDYRARLHSALTIEDVLVRHPKLRVYLMHAGYPLLDDLLAVLYTHPQVYVDVAVIDWGIPRAEFYRYLQTIVQAGYGNRVMFGSDNMVWPETIERGIQVIEQAPFLSERQKRDILYNNAARFLRLSEEQIRQQHAL